MQKFDKFYPCKIHDENRNTNNSNANDICTLRPDLELFSVFDVGRSARAIFYKYILISCNYYYLWNSSSSNH
jgi:hypothetical protein